MSREKWRSEYPELVRAIEGGAFYEEALAYGRAPHDTARERAAIAEVEAALAAFIGRPVPALLDDDDTPTHPTIFGVCILDTLWNRHGLASVKVDEPTVEERLAIGEGLVRLKKKEALR